MVLKKLARRPIRGLSTGLRRFLPKSLSCYFFSSSKDITIRISLGVTLRCGAGRKEGHPLILTLRRTCRKSAFGTVRINSSRSCRFTFSGGRNIIRVPARVPTLRRTFRRCRSHLGYFVIRPLLRKTKKVQVCSVSFLGETERLYSRCSILLVFSRITAKFNHANGHFITSLILPSVLILKGTLAKKCVNRTIAITGRGMFSTFCDSSSELTLVRNPAFVKGPLTYTITLGKVRVFRHRSCVDGVHRVRRISHNRVRTFASPQVGRIQVVNNYIYIRIRSSESLRNFRRFTCRQNIFDEPFLGCVCSVIPCIVDSRRLVGVFSIVGR